MTSTGIHSCSIEDDPAGSADPALISDTFYDITSRCTHLAFAVEVGLVQHDTLQFRQQHSLLVDLIFRTVQVAFGKFLARRFLPWVE